MPEADALASGLAAGSADNQETQDAQNQQTDGSAWVNGFDDGLKARVSKFKTPADLAKSYVELENYNSKTVQDMSAEERVRLFKKLGRPESPDGYELSTVIIPGVQRDATVDKTFKAFMHELGLSKDQTRRLHEWAMTNAANLKSVEKANETRKLEEQESALRAAWGASYDANQAKVEALMRLGGDEFVQFMNNGPGKAPSMRRGLHAISKLIADETLVSGRVVPSAEKKSEPGFVVDFSKSPELQGDGRHGILKR